MKIAILYRDLFRMQHAVADESRQIIKSFTETCEVDVLGRHGDYQIDGVGNKSYKTIFGLIRNLKFLKTSGFDAIVIQAPFTFDALIASFGSWFFGLDVVIQGFGQMSRYGVDRKLFHIDPEVKKLEDLQASPLSIGQKIKDLRSRLGKLLFMKAYQIVDRCWAAGWLTFSKFETAELDHLLGVKSHRCIPMVWPIKSLKLDNFESNVNWFDDKGLGVGKIRLVFWGRVDFKMKGIDRMINGFEELLTRHPSWRDRVVLYIIGPSYNESENLQEIIVRKGLKDSVVWLKPGDYTSGFLDPLRDADASILLSRWDGFPRSLRESLSLNVPIMVSRETNFEDVVDTYGCGVVVKNSDDPSLVASGFLDVLEILNDSQLCNSINLATSALHSEDIGKAAVKCIKRSLNIGDEHL